MENSKVLLQYALDAVTSAGLRLSDWEIGGGTVLARYFNHRLSKDIDVFIPDIQLLGELSPRFNASTEDVLDYVETGNFISLTYPEGKVDFIAGAQISPFRAKKEDFFGKSVYLENPVEIISKKIYYRGLYLKPRDLFDLAVVAHNGREKDLLDTLKTIPNEAEAFFSKYYEARLKGLQAFSCMYQESILPDGEKFIGKEFYVCDILRKHYLARTQTKGR